jgi:hypothetical protein
MVMRLVWLIFVSSRHLYQPLNTLSAGYGFALADILYLLGLGDFEAKIRRRKASESVKKQEFAA